MHADWTPFHEAILKGCDEVIRWLVLQGALCANASSEEIEGDRIYPNTCYRKSLKLSSSCKRLFERAKEVTQSHSALVTFLLGTLPPAPGKDQSCCAPLQCLSGHSGVRKDIGDFVGLEITKAKHLRILCQVVDVFPSFTRTDDEVCY